MIPMKGVLESACTSCQSELLNIQEFCEISVKSSVA